jgi:hypothetical protein
VKAVLSINEILMNEPMPGEQTKACLRLQNVLRSIGDYEITDQTIQEIYDFESKFKMVADVIFCIEAACESLQVISTGLQKIAERENAKDENQITFFDD